MPVVKISRLPDQVTELASFEAACGPVYFGDRTGPGPVREYGRECLAEGPIETRIVGNHEVSRLDKGPETGDVDHLSRDHVVSNPGQAGDIGRDWNTRLLKPAVHAGDIADLTGIVEGEGDSADFDDFVAALIEAGGFGIEDNALRRSMR
jgi:hypothetical protein